MEKLGIISGMGSQAGAWLFQRIIDLSSATTDQEYPEIIIHNNSGIPDRTEAILGRGSSPVAEILKSVKLLNDCGVDRIVMACMTAYFFHKDVAIYSNATFIHPLDILKEELADNYLYKKNVKTIGLIGSSGLLISRLFDDFFEPLGYKVISINPQEQEQYFNYPVYQCAKLGIVSNHIKNRFSYQVKVLLDRGADVVVGACSEVPLLLDKEACGGGAIDLFELLAKSITDNYHKLRYAT
ncbi:aspartate/glutamate racemase family protein [Mucilaginibacter sp. 21P]|uniref:aspartate/glutamate racemase family protein n=1 Tax=Mucilaginibacter sp. 21P TaxID=2778902 RepID=UPI001C5624F2|nr:amino acid racemase [Mucilaginibacter sp. 21P]QXV63871.1 aspartate/glutamate racemase family protein [Mucilaginibacter sp. 21P]